MTKRRYKVWLLTLFMCLSAGVGMSARTLPVLNRFSNRSFDGTVQVSWPVLFEGCTFRTDSIVLSRSYGAILHNCRIESTSGVLYMALEGDGIILSGCELTGCSELRFTPSPSARDRNYVSGVTIDGREYEVPDDDETVTDIEGLALDDIVNGLKEGPMVLSIQADKTDLKAGETATLRVRGLDEGMFLGWSASDPEAVIKVNADGFSCSVTMPADTREPCSVVVSAHTEYGLEAAEVIQVQPLKSAAKVKRHGWLWRLFHLRKR